MVPEAGSTCSPWLATKRKWAAESMAMFNGVIPVGRVELPAVKVPSDFTVYAETSESPCVLTNRAPVLEEVDELLVLHATKPSSKTETSSPGRKRNLVPILDPCPLSSSQAAEPSSHRQIEIQKYLHLCIRNIREEQTALDGWNHCETRKLPAIRSLRTAGTGLHLVGVRMAFRNGVDVGFWFGNRGRILSAIGSGKRQSNLDLQPTLGTIESFYATAVEAHRSLGDGKPQPGATSLAATRIVNAIEGPEELIQRFLGNAGARIDNTDHGFGTRITLASLQRDLRAGPFPRITRGIAHHIFNRAV